MGAYYLTGLRKNVELVKLWCRLMRLRILNLLLLEWFSGPPATVATLVIKVVKLSFPPTVLTLMLLLVGALTIVVSYHIKGQNCKLVVPIELAGRTLGERLCL